MDTQLNGNGGAASPQFNPSATPTGNLEKNEVKVDGTKLNTEQPEKPEKPEQNEQPGTLYLVEMRRTLLLRI